MKINSKILLITLPLIIIPAVVVGLISYRLSSSELRTAAQDTLISRLANSVDICSQQAATTQAAGGKSPVALGDAQAVAVQGLQAATFGKTGYTMVVDASGTVVAHPSKQYLDWNISAEPWFSNIINQDAGSFSYAWEGKTRRAQYQRFQDWGWYIITSETEAELLRPINRLSTYTASALILSLLLAFIAMVFFTRRLTAPIRSLVAGTESVRDGIYTSPITVTSNDEFGSLATVFNTMVGQQREMVGSLEQRVSERTKEVDQRASQLQAVSEIAKEAVSTHDMNILLDKCVNLIQERFGLYHVSIYIPDEQRQFAILRAGSGEVGSVMVQRSFRVRIGETGIVSHVFGSGDTRVINDVTTDFAYVKNSLLPDTASAAAVPVKADGKVIGVIHVENTKVNTFTGDMVSALQTLADQLSVAIENARLLDELRSSLKETRTLNQRYTQESWSGTTKTQKTSGYQFDLSQVSSYNLDLDEELRSKLLAGHAIPIKNQQIDGYVGDTDTVVDTENVSARSALIAPLILYDQLIGVLGIEEDSPDHQWSGEEISLLEAISNQVSLTLDNARLVEETQLRSEQIRLLQEITAEAASHVKLDELLEAVTLRLLIGYNLSHCGVAMLDRAAGSVEGKEKPQPTAEREIEATSTIVAYTSSPGAPGPDLKGTKIPIDVHGLAHKVLESHKAIAVNDKPHPTMLMAPLVARGESFGMITMEVTDPERQFDEDDLRLLEQIGLQISAAIEVARNFEQTTNRAEYERLISGMTTRIRETLDVETMVKTAVKEVQQALKLPEVVIRLGLPTKRESVPGAVQPELTATLTGEIK